MLRIVLLFLVAAIVAAFLGFQGDESIAAQISRILFFICVIAFVTLLVINYFQK